MANPMSSLKGTVKWATVEVVHARAWTIDVVNKVSEYASNQTFGKVGALAGVYDVKGTITVYSTDGGSSLIPGKVARLQLYSNATSYWDVQDAIIVDSKPEVDMETGKIIGVSHNWRFAGKADATFGTITAPDGTAIRETTPT